MDKRKVKKLKVRRVVKIVTEDGVLLPYGFMVTPDERDYLIKNHTLYKHFPTSIPTSKELKV
jgi:hypothetical protein